MQRSPAALDRDQRLRRGQPDRGPGEPAAGAAAVERSRLRPSPTATQRPRRRAGDVEQLRAAVDPGPRRVLARPGSPACDGGRRDRGGRKASAAKAASSARDPCRVRWDPSHLMRRPAAMALLYAAWTSRGRRGGRRDRLLAGCAARPDRRLGARALLRRTRLTPPPIRFVRIENAKLDRDGVAPTVTPGSSGTATGSTSHAMVEWRRPPARGQPQEPHPDRARSTRPPATSPPTRYQGRRLPAPLALEAQRDPARQPRRPHRQPARRPARPELLTPRTYVTVAQLQAGRRAGPVGRNDCSDRPIEAQAVLERCDLVGASLAPRPGLLARGRRRACCAPTSPAPTCAGRPRRADIAGGRRERRRRQRGDDRPASRSPAPRGPRPLRASRRRSTSSDFFDAGLDDAPLRGRDLPRHLARPLAPRRRAAPRRHDHRRRHEGSAASSAPTSRRDAPGRQLLLRRPHRRHPARRDARRRDARDAASSGRSSAGRPCPTARWSTATAPTGRGRRSRSPPATPFVTVDAELEP